MILLLSLLLSFQSTTRTATASWSLNPAADNVTIYRLHYGTASGNYTTIIDTPAPATSTIVPGLIPGTTYYFALQALSASAASGLTAEVVFIVPLPCQDSAGNNVVQLRVLDFTPSLAAGGLGRLLWTITSVSRIVNITATLSGNTVAVIDGSDSKTLDLARSAGVNFNAPAASGNYVLIVSATDVNGCKADTSSVNRVINVP